MYRVYKYIIMRVRVCTYTVMCRVVEYALCARVVHMPMGDFPRSRRQLDEISIQ